SFIGLRGKQEIGDGLYAVFNLQTLFNPLDGMNSNGVGALVQNNGLGQAPQLGTWANSYGDSSKAGQMFNNAAYFGISSPTYGTFTMGRQSALSSDLVVNYDALSGANAWSLLTFEGEQRPCVRTGERVIVDDEVRAQCRLTAHGEGTVGRRTDTEVSRVVEHLAGLRRVAVGVGPGAELR